MARTRVVIHKGKPFRDVFNQWAENDGQRRAERVAESMRSRAPVDTGAYQRGIEVTRDEHPDRPVFHIGSSVDYAGVVEANTGNAVRALDAAG